MKADRTAYTIWLRAWHWSNALLFVTLLITGLRIHVSRPGLFGFRADVLIHNVAGILLTLFYFLFLYGNLRLGNGGYYRIVAGDIEPGIIRQIRYYLWGIFVGQPHPYPHSEDRKFNPLQKLIYLVVMYFLLPILVVTGWALLFPDKLPTEMFGQPGLGLGAIFHTYTGFSLALFMVVHVYLGTTGSTPATLFCFMWTGKTDTEEEAKSRDKEPQVAAAGGD